MKIQLLERLFFSDSTMSRFQDNVTNFSRQLIDNPFLKGNLIESISLTSSAVKIEHKLAKIPLGYLVIGQDGNSVIYSTAKDEKFLTLQASSSVTASVWIF